MKRNDIYDGVEYSPIGVKHWYENAALCDDYNDRCGVRSSCSTCMYRVSLSEYACEKAEIQPTHRLYCTLSVPTE